MSWWRRLWWPTTHGEPVARQLARVQPRPMSELGEGGIVCLSGVVDPLEALLEAPLTGRRCVYWAVTATELRWNLSSYERGSRDQGVPFFLVGGVVPGAGRGPQQEGGGRGRGEPSCRSGWETRHAREGCTGSTRPHGHGSGWLPPGLGRTGQSIRQAQGLGESPINSGARLAELTTSRVGASR